MSAARRSSLVALLALPALLVACSSAAPAPSAAPTGVTASPSATPAQARAPAPTSASTDWHRFSTENGMATISVPPTWTVEGGSSESVEMGYPWIWVRNSLHQEMALPSIGNGGDRGGDRMQCFTNHDVAVPDGYPRVMLGTPSPTIGGGLWMVDSFEAGERCAETDEYTMLVDVLRSLRLGAGP